MDRLPKNFPRAFAFGKRIASDSMQQSTFEASTLHTQLDRHPVLRNLTKSIATCTGVRGIPHLRLTTHELTSVLGKGADPGAETRVFTEPAALSERCVSVILAAVRCPRQHHLLRRTEAGSVSDSTFAKTAACMHTPAFCLTCPFADTARSYRGYLLCRPSSPETETSTVTLVRTATQAYSALKKDK